MTTATENNVLDLSKVLVDWASILSFSKPKPHISGAKVVNLNLKTARSYVRLSNPLMLTWGAQEGVDSTTKQPTGKWSLSLQMPSEEYTNDDCRMFRLNLDNLEKCCKEIALENSLEWFGKKTTSMEVIDNAFNDMFHYPKIEKGSQIPDKTKSPTINIKIPCYNGKWKSEIYDEDCNPLFVDGRYGTSPLEFLPKRCLMMGIMEIGGIWISNGKASITFNLYQAIVQRPKVDEPGICLLKPKTEDVALMKSHQPDPISLEEEVNSVIVEDDEVSTGYQQIVQKKEEPVAVVAEQIVESVSEEPAAEPVKKAPPKVVRKVKTTA
jgi:hypothetical protein